MSLRIERTKISLLPNFDARRFQGLVTQARRAALEAGRFALDHRGQTGVDITVQRTIVDKLRFPGLAVLAEEGDLNRRPVESFHALAIVDPIDGTDDYEKGGSEFAVAVSIALAHQGSADASVFLYPIYSALYAPAFGMGGTFFQANTLTRRATINGETFKVLGRMANLSRQGASYYVSARAEPLDCARQAALDQLKKIFANTFVRQLGPSGLLHMCSTVVPDSGSVLHYKTAPKVWDAMAALHFVEMAGGQSCYSDGKPIFPMALDEIIFREQLALMPSDILCGIQPAVNKVLRAFGKK